MDLIHALQREKSGHKSASDSYNTTRCSSEQNLLHTHSYEWSTCISQETWLEMTLHQHCNELKALLVNSDKGEGHKFHATMLKSYKRPLILIKDLSNPTNRNDTLFNLYLFQILKNENELRFKDARQKRFHGIKKKEEVIAVLMTEGPPEVSSFPIDLCYRQKITAYALNDARLYGYYSNMSADIFTA